LLRAEDRELSSERPGEEGLELVAGRRAIEFLEERQSRILRLGRSDRDQDDEQPRPHPRASPSHGSSPTPAASGSRTYLRPPGKARVPPGPADRMARNAPHR